MDSNEAVREKLVRWHDPHEVAERSRGFSGRQLLEAILMGSIPPPPFAALLGVRITDVGDGRVTFEATPGEEHYNPAGVAHGGFAISLLDFALGSAISTMLPAGSSYGTIDVHARLLRPITAGTGTIRCEGQIVSVTRTLATSEARILDKKARTLATGTTACAIQTLAV